MVKKCKDQNRDIVLENGLEGVFNKLKEHSAFLPLSLSYQATSLDVRQCSYFNSKTLPLKLYFKGPQNTSVLIPAIYKVS